MKPIDASLNEYRRSHPIFNIEGDDFNGMFLIPYKNYKLRIIISSGGKWEHASVSVCGIHRNPNWDEMNFIKNLFWNEEETVVQFHPKKSEYISLHPYVLHLWKKKNYEYDLPDSFMI